MPGGSREVKKLDILQVRGLVDWSGKKAKISIAIELSVAAAQNYRTLRARGKTVRKTVDCLIATFCILNDNVLLHADSDFHHFERELGLKVLHPECS
jgi:predicted nucleic acid-binding protein